MNILTLKEKINLKRVARDRRKSGFAALMLKKENLNIDTKNFIDIKFVKANKKFISIKIKYKNGTKIKTITIKRWGVTNG